MNTETGKVYEGAEIDAALARGEKLATISHQAAERIRKGRQLLAARERERRTRKRRRVHDGLQKASRKANRRR
jgi:hypothetical protein